MTPIEANIKIHLPLLLKALSGNTTLEVYFKKILGIYFIALSYGIRRKNLREMNPI